MGTLATAAADAAALLLGVVDDGDEPEGLLLGGAGHDGSASRDRHVRFPVWLARAIGAAALAVLALCALTACLCYLSPGLRNRCSGPGACCPCCGSGQRMVRSGDVDPHAGSRRMSVPLLRPV